MITAPVQPEPILDEEALFREARRLRRRRWMIGTASVAVLAGVAAAIVVLAGTGNSTTASGKGAGTAAGLPTGSFARLNVAGALAVGPNGALYVTDVARERILVRLPDGRFRVVAGSGRIGFSGDGGPAVDAELSAVSDIAFSSGGSLYIVDGGRVRVVSPNGVIRTIAGDGRAPAGQSPHPIANGTPALSAPLGSPRSIADGTSPPSIAVSPGGALYLSTFSQLLRLTAIGELETIRAVVLSGPWAGNLDENLGPIAIDAQGNIDVAGVNGWSIWQVPPSGVAHQIGFGPSGQARRSGGNVSVLERGPDSAVYGEDGNVILRVQGDRLVPTFTFHQNFWLTHFAFGPNGTLYADEIPGGEAFETRQQLVSVRDTHVSLLWQESSTTRR